MSVIARVWGIMNRDLPLSRVEVRARDVDRLFHAELVRTEQFHAEAELTIMATMQKLSGK